ncbi:MAG: hypothetical protein E7337_13935 [Clostridiales bacterium]|nr:hypothetical protein [Clostridiales bacterium]
MGRTSFSNWVRSRLDGKRVFAFATSGGSGIGRTAEKLAPHVKGAASVDAKLVHSAVEVKDWVRL